MIHPFKAFLMASAILLATTAVAAPQPTAPSSPSGLKAVSSTSSSIQLDWQNNGRADRIEIERLSQTSFAPLARVGGSVELYFDTGLTQGIVQTYRVRACNKHGNRMACSTYSNESSAAPAEIPTPTPAPTWTPKPPSPTPTDTPIIPTSTPTPTSIAPTPTSPPGPTPTATLVPFAPLVRHPEVVCAAGEVNWYGEGCKKYLGIFGHDRIGQTTRNLVSRHKVGLQCGIAIDKSVKPNRIAVASCDHNLVLGWKYWGTCSDGTPCTWPSDCPAIDSCVGNPMRDADIQIPRTDVKDGACNGDDNIGFRGPAGRDRLCLINTPDNSNMAESFYSLPMEFDANGNLLMCDRYNGRCIQWNKPFDTDGLIDQVWGQDDFTSNLMNKGLPQDKASDTSLWTVQQPARAYKGAPGISSDGAGGVWIADPGNARVVHANAGTKNWDVCLGQANCSSGVYPRACWGNVGNTGPLPLDVICNAQRAKPGPDGNLYVLDSGRDGWGGVNYDGRILVFVPPFVTGKAADHQIIPQITQIKDQNGTVYPYSFRGYDFRFDESGKGLLWMLDNGRNGYSQRALLLSGAGNVVSQPIGARAVDEAFSNYNGCGDPMQNYYWMHSNAMDVAPEGIWGTGLALFARYTFPAFNWTNSTGQVCPPRSAGGLLENQTWWGANSPATLNGPNRALAIGGQLIVGDSPGTKVWNDYTHKVLGAPADFELPNQIGNSWINFSHMATDGTGHLWWTEQDKGLLAAKLPLTAFSKALMRDNKLYWADDGTEILGALAKTPTAHVAYDKKRDRILVMSTQLGAILGIRNYREVETGAKLLVDWVQGAPDKAHLNSCNQGGLPTAQTLCSGGQLAVSPRGDLWVNDMAGDNWDTKCGNNRVLGYLTEDIDASLPVAAGTVVFANLSAKRIIRPGGASYTTPGVCGVYQASTIAVDGKGRLWMSGHGGSGYAPTPYSFWQIVEYDDPLNKQAPDHYVRIPQGYTPDLQFDPDNGNLIITGGSFAEVYAINPEEWLTPLP